MKTLKQGASGNHRRKTKEDEGFNLQISRHDSSITTKDENRIAGALTSSRWIAPSWVHSTCRSNNQHLNQVQRTGGSAPHQIYLQISRHDSWITTKDENPEAGRKRESPKEDEGRRRFLFTDQSSRFLEHHQG
jgi:hypothetical protein